MPYGWEPPSYIPSPHPYRGEGNSKRGLMRPYTKIALEA